MDPDRKLTALKRLLGQSDKVAVAFSGGVDSTFLLAVARETLGHRQVLALTAETPFLAAAEIEETRRLVKLLDVRQVVVPCDPLESADVAENPPLRCYHCKLLLFGKLQAATRQAGFEILLDGSNLDDQDDYRPGHKALTELQIPSPLLAADLTKEEIRILSRRMGLPTADKPSMACLASRFPYGQQITRQGLRQVDRCETFLRKAGFRVFRVRHHGQVARIEVDLDEMPGILKDEMRAALLAECRAAGFTFVALDLAGYRTGSLNENLTGDDA